MRCRLALLAAVLATVCAVAFRHQDHDHGSHMRDPHAPMCSPAVWRQVVAFDALFLRG